MSKISYQSLKKILFSSLYYKTTILCTCSFAPFTLRYHIRQYQYHFWLYFCHIWWYPIFFLTFDSSIITLGSTNITFDCNFVTFNDFFFLLIFDSSIVVLSPTNIMYGRSQHNLTPLNYLIMDEYVYKNTHKISEIPEIPLNILKITKTHPNN